MLTHNITASSSNSLFSASRESSQQNLGLTVLAFLTSVGRDDKYLHESHASAVSLLKSKE